MTTRLLRSAFGRSLLCSALSCLFALGSPTLHGQTTIVHGAEPITPLTACVDFFDGDVYTDSGGSASSYSSGENLEVTFCAEAGETVSFTFTNFSTESCCDELTVSGDDNGNDGTYAGATLPPVMTSSVGGCITFTFNSDGSVTGSGWEATIATSGGCAGSNQEVVHAPEANTDAFNACVDFFDGDVYTDSGGSAGNYSNSQTREVTFCAEAGETVSFTFTSFGTESCCDGLTVSGDANGNDGVYFGATLPPVMTSSVGGCITFTFSSDSSVSGSGWEATIATSGGCAGSNQEVRHSDSPPVIFTACEDFEDGDTYTDSGGAGANYSSSESSATQICAAAGETVTVTFTSFATENCCDDLTVFGDANGNDGSYAGATLPPAMTSSVGGCLNFNFNSDGSVASSGWEATLTTSAACVVACVDMAGPEIDDASARPMCDETFVMETNFDYIYTITPSSNGTSNSRDCRSAVIWRTPRFSDDCGIDSVSISFSAESVPAATIIPDALTYGPGSTEIMDGVTDGFVQFITPSTYFYGSGASASTTTRVTYEVFDAQGNSETCSFLVEVVDNEDPIIDTCPEDFITAGDESVIGNGDFSDLAYSETSATITEAQFIAEGGDIDENCGVETITYIDTQMGSEPIIVTRTFTVTDYVGLSVECVQTITINECIVELTCQDLTVYVDGAGNASITPEEVQVTGSCDNSELSLSQSTFTCADVANGPITVTLTQGTITPDKAPCQAMITVLDTIRPVVTCTEFARTFSGEDQCANFIGANSPSGDFFDIFDLTMFRVAAGGSRIDTVDLTGCVTDNCEGLQYAFVDSYEENRVLGCSVDIINVAVIRDASDNEATDSIFFRATIMYEGPAPVIICPANAQLECGEEPAVMASDADATSGCGNPVVTVSEAVIVGEPNVSGTTYTYTYTATDGCGQMSTCEQVFTVLDDMAPVVMANDTTLYLDVNGLAQLFIEDYEYAASDNCEVTLTDIFRFEEGAVIDDLSGAAAGANNAKSRDQVLSFFCDDVGNVNLRVEIIAFDPTGNETRDTITVTVLDTFPPDAVCMDITVQLDENGEGSLASADNTSSLIDGGSTDNCGPLTFEESMTAFTCENLGENTVTLTLTDPSDNVSTCDATVTVEDNVPPTAICMDITVQLDDEGNASIATDGDGAPVTEVSGELDPTDPTWNRPNNIGMAPGGCTPSAFSGTDASYETFSFTIDVADMYTFSMPDNPGPDFFFALYEGGFDATLPCTNLLATDDDTNGTEPELMIQLNLVPGDYTLVTTTFGNDNTAGAYTYFISSENGGNVLAGGGGAATSAIDGGSDDNCGPLTFSESMTEFTCDNVGPNTVTLTVTDGSGNMSTCDAIVTVEDNVPPVITVTPQTVVLSDDDGTATLTVQDLASATDACGIASLTASQLLYTCEDIGEVEVTITATDNNGNVTTAPVIVTVTFNQPELACIGEINLTLNDECQALVIPQMLLTGNVACLDVFNWDIVVQDSDPSNGPIIDGCGSFTYSISAGSNGDEPTVGFTNEFAEENWDVDFIDDDPTLETSVEFTDETLTFTTFGQSPINFNEAFASIQLSENGTVSFDFSYNGVDPFTGFFGDFAVIQTSFEGVALMTEFFDNEASGSRTLAVSAGETLTFALSDDGLFALPPNEDLASIFEISNFLFERPISPFDLDFETCWGVVNAEDKTSPEADFVPADVTLLCVDFESDANNVSTLPNSVSRCYRVDAETGNTIAGTMAPALRARLLAGRTSLEGPLVPTFTDGCAQELEVCVSDAVAFGEDADCDDIVLTRTFVATEISTCVSAGGEMNAPAVASYTITFDRPTLADLNTDGIQDVVEYEQCGTVNPTRADYPAPRAGDFPSLIVGDRVFNLRSGEAVCNIGVTYSDGEAIVTCPYTYKFIRTYTVIDWCDPSDVRTFTQVVKVGDTTAPVLTGPNVATNDAGDLVYGTNAGNICAAYLRLDDISVVDNCSGTNVSVSAEIFPGGDDTGAPIGAFTVVPGGAPELSSAIPAGRHLLRYTSTDECGNTSIDDFFFVVEDQTPPVAICEDGLNISIAGGANNGFAVLTPENIDNGSYDDCSGVSLSIARVNSSDLPIGTYGPQITLTCADLGTVRVGLRVEDALGNVNFCWLDVLVEDKLRPTCVAPANTTITCTEYNTTLPADIQDATDAQLDAIFGAAAGVDNCGTTITQSISGDVNSCGVGTFTRTFVSTDDAGFTNAGACTQRIDVIGIHDYRLTFPTDESGDCADIPEYDGVGAEELACDLITTTTDVDTLRTLDAGDECFKLRITYDVVNWCEYNSLGDPYLVTRDGSGVNNRQRQPRNIDEDVLYVNVIPNNTAGTGDDQAFMTLFTDRALNTNAPQRDQEFVGYAGSDSRGFFRYTQFIKIYDEVAPEITFTELDECFAGSGEGCRTTVTIEFTALDECSDAVVGLELDANYVEAAGFNPDNAAALGIGVSLDNDGEGNYTVTATNVPVGEHALRVRAADGCGNFDVRIIEFCVTADRTPTPICIQTLTVVLMDDNNGGGTAAIWASDFIASPIEDCFGNEVTKYSLFRSSEAGAAGFVPSFDPPATNGIDDIDCADFEAGTVSVRVYAFDDNGSTPDYCEVIVEVQDNMGWCDDGGSGNIAGLITDQDDVAVDNVSVTLTGGMEMTTTTDASGQYRFAGLPLGVDYTVQPELDAPVNLRNVKSSDLVSMIGQILGTTTFDSPYDFVAADVNGDMELNIFDVVNVSQVILGQVDLFDGGESWVFVEANAVIDVANPYAATFPEVYNANDLAGTITADFVAVEMGNPFGQSNRTVLNLTTDEAQLEAGQTHTIVLDGTELAAFQGTLELGAGLELIGAEYTGEGGMNLNRAGEGMIAVALRTPSPTPPHGGGATENASRFGVTLTVRATTAVTLSEELSLTDAITVREGVGANGVGNGLDLAFNGELAPATAQNVLHQNTPNPVRLETVIRFELAQAAPATLTLRDAAGRLVSVQEIDAAAGMNMVELTNIKASGVLTYTLTAGEFTASKKMVVVK